VPLACPEKRAGGRGTLSYKPHIPRPRSPDARQGDLTGISSGLALVLLPDQHRSELGTVCGWQVGKRGGKHFEVAGARCAGFCAAQSSNPLIVLCFCSMFDSCRGY
jgi:hypothetical protein